MLPFILQYARAIPVSVHIPTRIVYSAQDECNLIAGTFRLVIESDEDVSFTTGTIITKADVDHTSDEAGDRY